jgi:hypothetical protein
MPKKNVYDTEHTHDTVGELVYHLKSLDYNIFLQLYNKIGYENDIINTIYEKVNNINNKKDILNIKNGDKLAQKIKLIYNILKKLKEQYSIINTTNVPSNILSAPSNTSSAPSNTSSAPSNTSNTFNKLESCIKVPQSSPYTNKTIGCPQNYYMKGIEFGENITCCKMNAGGLNIKTVPKTDIDIDSNDVFQSFECDNNGILNNFSYITVEKTLEGGATNEYYIKNMNDKFIRPLYDSNNGKYILTQNSSDDPSNDDTPKNNNLFSLEKEGGDYYIHATKLTDMYISINNNGEVLLSGSEPKTKFELIKHNEYYIIKKHLENKIITYKDAPSNTTSAPQINRLKVTRTDTSNSSHGWGQPLVVKGTKCNSRNECIEDTIYVGRRGSGPAYVDLPIGTYWTFPTGIGNTGENPQNSSWSDTFKLESDTPLNTTRAVEQDKLILISVNDINNPDNNQLFTINKTTPQNSSMDVRSGCYDASAIPITLTDVSIGPNIQCKTNEYLTGITHNGDTLEGKCVQIPESEPHIKAMRAQFFKKPISFEHTHSFVAGDPIHNDTESSSSIDEDNINTLELYSNKHKAYLNTFDGYSPIQKIFLTMMILRLNGIKKVNLEYISVYKFFKKQSDMDTAYNVLMATAPPQTTAQP